MSERVTRWRRAALGSLALTAIFTLAFVVSACYPLSQSYSMTSFMMTGHIAGTRFASANYLTLTTWTECAYTADPKAGVICTDYLYDGLVIRDLLPLIGVDNPASTGNAVIAFQSLILVLLIWPFVGVVQPDLKVPYKALSSISCLLLAVVFGALSLAVWGMNCVAGLRRTECVAPACQSGSNVTIDPQISGATRFEIFIFVEMIWSLTCTILFYYYLNKDVPNGPLIDGDDAEKRRTTNSTAYYQV